MDLYKSRLYLEDVKAIASLDRTYRKLSDRCDHEKE